MAPGVAFRWPGVALLLAIAAAAAVMLAPHGPLRTVAVVSFLLVGPGLAFVARWPVPDATSRLVVALGLSVALDVMAALTLLVLGRWDATYLLVLLAAVAGLAALVQLVVPPEAFPRTRRPTA
jgi:hypothetical protein